MQVTVNISEKLVAEAIADGSTPESYVEKMLTSQTVLSDTTMSRPRRPTREEFSAALDRLAQFSDKIPDLPIEAFSRASFYEDHD